MTTALVPVKRLSEGKSRLHARLDRTTIIRLSTCMLKDVLETLQSVEELTRVGVVTPDPEVARIARSVGAEAFVRPDPGLNPSLDQTANELFSDTQEPLLVVMADLPAARREDLCTLLATGAALGERGVVLAPTHDGGTAALLRIPYNVIPAAFGAQSAARHAALAAHADVPFRELVLPSLHFDIDEPRDLETLFDSSQAGTHTRRALLEISEKSTACNRSS